jgi:DNA repair exonuclease SbcCD ATPase subunit
MIKVKVGKKAPVMEKKKQLNELDPLSMAVGGGIILLLQAAFKYLGPMITKLLGVVGTKLETAKEEVQTALKDAETIPEETKNDILEKLNAAEEKLKQTLELVQKEASSVEAAKSMEKRPSAMVADDVEAYNNVVREAKMAASKERAVLEALDKAEKKIAEVQKQIASLDMTAAIGSMKDGEGLFRKVPEINIKDETKWIQFASLLATNAKSTAATA